MVVLMKNSFSKLINAVLALPRFTKRLVVCLLDVSLCMSSVWIAYYLRTGEYSMFSINILIAVILSICLALPIFIFSGLYRAIFRFSGWQTFLKITGTVVIYGFIYASIITVIGIQDIPRTIGIIQPILLLVFMSASRVFAQILLGDQYNYIRYQSPRYRVLIYGAGNAGRQLVAAIASSQEMKVIGYIDDDDRLQGHLLNGLPIYNPADLLSLVKTLSISTILLALPNVNRKRRYEILNQMRIAHVSVRTLPSMIDLARGRVSLSDLRELDVDDLLGRESVAPNHILLMKNIHNKLVMVTGAGGSIGSELCRQIIAIGPAKLLLIEQNEYALYAIHKELQEKFEKINVALVPLLASTQDKNRMHEIISTWRPETLYHAAAYKLSLIHI